MQTSREVINALLRNQKAERVGLHDSPWEDAILAWIQQGYPTRMEYHAAGENRWRTEDGKWEEVEVPGEYLEPEARFDNRRFHEGRRCGERANR